MNRYTRSFTLLLVPCLAACEVFVSSPSATSSPSGRSEYRPEVVGVVRSLRFVESSVIELRVADEATIEIDLNADFGLENSNPDRGDLLFYGTEPVTWYLAIPDYNDPSCYIVEGWATETIEDLQFNFGLVLPKAEDFDRGSGNFSNPAGSQFCVNERGEVLRLRE